MKQKAKHGYKLVKSQFKKFDEIPITWDESISQGDVCKFINGYAFSKSEFRKSGYPIIRIQNLNGGKKYLYSDIPLPEKQFAKAGDLLFAWSATFGPFIWDGPKAAFHYHQWKVIPSKNTDKKFLYYHLLKISSKIKQMGQSGLGMIHMTKDSMEKFKVNFPPKPEQEKIASILDNIDYLIKQIQEEIEYNTKLKNGLMEKLLIKGIGHKKFKKIDWYYGGKIEIPDEWDVIPLQDIIVKQNSGLHNKLEEISSGDNIVGMVDLYTHDVIDGEEFTLSNFPKEVKGKKIDKEKYLLEENDFLYIEISLVKNGIGKTVRVSKNGMGTYFAGNLRRFSIKDTLNPIFLFYYLNLDMSRNYMINHSYTSAQTGITMKDYFKIKILIPKKEKEQEKIASILSNLDIKIKHKQEYKKYLEILQKELMEKLLTGEIRVSV